MEEIIYNFSKRKAKNAQHAQFVTDVLAAVPEDTATAQGFAAQREAFAAAAVAELDCFQMDKGYLATPEIAAADQRRDDVYLFYKQLVGVYANYCPNEDKRQASATLAFAFREAGDVARLDYAGETAVLTDLVERLAEEPYAGALATLGLEDMAAVLEEANGIFNTLYLERNAQERDRSMGSRMKALRPASDEAFDGLAKAVNALYAVNEMVAKDPEKSTALKQVIDDVNAVVVRFRKTISKASPEEEEEEA